MDRGAALNCHIVHNWTAKDASATQNNNKDEDLSLPKASGTTKNGAVSSPPEEGA
jgi:hypothetical protein